MMMGRILSLAILAVVIGITTLLVLTPDHHPLRQLSHLNPYSVEHTG
ncbi:hypothetical protein LB518_10680 [Mesorhizobium sp. BR1-1-16]|nr:hypothetical protein [Mesorhizobium sp. BR1-1-16]MBZ9936761.1 hypothetical protein [Mesorhizobium sp. BR1-1-16]